MAEGRATMSREARAAQGDIFRTILVPHDFSRHATQALRLAASLAARDGGRLLVLHVLPPLYPPHRGAPWIPDAALVGRVRRRLTALADRVPRHAGVGCECRVEVGGPFEHIMNAASEADAIVMSTAGRTGLARLVIGSVAERVVRHSSIPVLTVRPPARSGRVRAAPAARRRR